MMEDDEFKGWDPRARWAEENNENLGDLILERKMEKKRSEILIAGKERPRTATELFYVTGHPATLIHHTMNWAKRRGAAIETNRTKDGILYHVIKTPDFMKA